MGLAKTGGLSELVEQFQTAHLQTGRGVMQLLWHAMKLRYGKTAVGFSEYFGYRLYDRSLIPDELVDTFLSEDFGQQIWKATNPPSLWGQVSDKVFFQLLMEKLGFSQPPLVALYSPEGRDLPGVTMLCNSADVETFLREAESFPLFGKPGDSYRSYGSVAIARYDQKRSLLVMTNGEERTIEEFADMVAQEPSYLFQKKLSSHTSVVDLTGDSLSTFRIALLFQKQGPELFRVVWRIPTGKNMADNFWRPGNLVAHVDCDDAKVYSVIQSVEPSGFVGLGHDDPLGERFLQSTPPLYDDAIDLVMKASRVFPSFGYQAWDVAVTDDGPVIIEMNHNGGIDILQMGARKGIMDEQFRRLLATKGLKLRNPKVPFFG